MNDQNNQAAEMPSRTVLSGIRWVYMFTIVCIVGPPIFGLTGFLYGEVIGKRLVFELPFAVALVFSIPISYYLAATYTVVIALYIGFRSAVGGNVGVVEVALCALVTVAFVPPVLLFGNIKYIPDQLIRFGPPLVIEALVCWFILMKVGLLGKHEPTP